MNDNITSNNITKKHILIMLVIVLCLCFGLAGVYKKFIIPISNDKGSAIEINNEQSGNLGPIGESLSVEQTFKFDKKFSAIGIRFSTYNRINKGQIIARLVNLDSESEIKKWDIKTEDLLDNSFYKFRLDDVIDEQSSTNYKIILDIEVEDNNSITITTSSKDMYTDGKLYINGQEKNEDICLVAYSENSNFLRNMFVIAAVIMVSCLTLSYYMIFVRKAKIENIFLVSALVLGTMYAFLQTPYSNYDEPAHVETIYRMSNNLMRIEEPQGSEGEIYRREEDTLKGLSCAQTTIDTYKTVYEKLFEMSESSKLVPMKARKISEVRYVYMPTTLAITLARIIGMGQVQLLIFGRLVNLMFFIAAVYYSIKKIPFAKMTMFAVGMLPMTLHQAASFSYDGPIMAIAFLFITYLLRIAYVKEVDLKDFIQFFAFVILLAPLKKVYILMIILILIISSKRFINKKKYYRFLLTTIAIAGMSYLFFNIVEAITLINKTESVSVFSTEPAYTISTIIHYPIWYLKILSKSLFFEFFDFVQNGIISIYMVKTSKIVMYIFAILICISALRYDDEKVYINRREKSIILIFISIIVVALYTAGFLWTPVGKDIIQGVQGRYILPFAPVVLLLLRLRKISRPIKTDKLLMFAILFSQVGTITYVFVRILLNS